ncbi:MAG: hypothetical protein KKE55_02400 [Candidatus Omnitrophica bacterium]|nr:hypothetical protein [Candidatus Omnitrophota bacterium]
MRERFPIVLILTVLFILSFTLKEKVYSVEEDSLTGSTYASKDKIVVFSEEKFEVMYTGKAMVNGNIWKILTNTQKEVYMLGYEDGVVNAAMYYLPDEKIKKEVYGTLPSSMKNISLTELIERIDEFYSHGENINIAIPYIFSIIRNQLAEVNPGTIDEYIKYLRNIFDKGYTENEEDKAPPLKVLGGSLRPVDKALPSNVSGRPLRPMDKTPPSKVSGGSTCARKGIPVDKIVEDAVSD